MLSFPFFHSRVCVVFSSSASLGSNIKLEFLASIWKFPLSYKLRNALIQTDLKLVSYQELSMLGYARLRARDTCGLNQFVILDVIHAQRKLKISKRLKRGYVLYRTIQVDSTKLNTMSWSKLDTCSLPRSSFKSNYDG
jgi:hypothetical protein